MDLEMEIPIWYNGKMKWISNLTTRSTCSDVIQAILSSDENYFPPSNHEYVIYECWRGVERPLKARCRLLKLWNSWAGESQNVTLTLRTEQQQRSASTQLLLRKQDKKLEKLKRQLKRTDKQIEKFSQIESDNQQSMTSYLNLYRSIIHTQSQLEQQQKLIAKLMTEIEDEHRFDFNPDQLSHLLTDVNQTLMISRELTEQSEELDQQIHRTNDEIDRKQSVLDDLELDHALDQNIDLDSLDDEEQDQMNFLFKQERVSTKDLSPSPTLPSKSPSTGLSRPTAIVEPSLSSSLTKSKSFSEQLVKPSRPHFHPRYNQHYPWSLSTNDESDTGISSFNSTDEQLVTLV